MSDVATRPAPPRLRWQLSLKTRLLLTMLSLLLMSVSSLFVLHLYAERQLVSQLGAYTEDLSTAIEVFQEQPAREGDPTVVLEAYAQKLRQLGVKDVSIADRSDEVQVSTNPTNVGRKLVRTQRRGPKEWVVRGVLGAETGPPGTQTTSVLTIPIVVGDRRVGNLVVTRYLDDFSALSQRALMSRVYATLGVFGVGMVLALYLSWSFNRPVQQLTQAARRVAAGDLDVQVAPSGAKEIASLSQNFNEMVLQLRENKRLEEQLHFAERSTALGRLASAMAHEIRNPLNFINLSIDHLRERLAPAEPARRQDFDRILLNVKAEVSRLNRLVGDFLSFGKPARLHPRPCAVDELVREVVALVEPKARDQGIAVHVAIGADVPVVTADPELLKTCVLNLMINALDALADGGLLSVAVEKITEGGTEVVQIAVTDTGPGMSAEEIRSAFEPYFSTKETGLGLGLALTHKIVTDHGGRITLESTSGRGTVARIVLPLQPPGTVGAFPRAVAV
jgi:signal transduction histidine kinase